MISALTAGLLIRNIQGIQSVTEPPQTEPLQSPSHLLNPWSGDLNKENKSLTLIVNKILVSVIHIWLALRWAQGLIKVMSPTRGATVPPSGGPEHVLSLELWGETAGCSTCCTCCSCLFGSASGFPAAPLLVLVLLSMCPRGVTQFIGVSSWAPPPQQETTTSVQPCDEKADLTNWTKRKPYF